MGFTVSGYLPCQLLSCRRLDNEEIKGFSLRELLMYILLFYFSVQS